MRCRKARKKRLKVKFTLVALLDNLRFCAYIDMMCKSGPEENKRNKGDAVILIYTYTAGAGGGSSNSQMCGHCPGLGRKGKVCAN